MNQCSECTHRGLSPCPQHDDSLNFLKLRHAVTSQPVDTPAGVDLAQVVAGAAQQALSAARRRGQRILFDYEGPIPHALNPADGNAIHTVAEYLLAWIIRCPAEDCVSFSARAHWPTPSRCRFCITAANVDLGTQQSMDDLGAFAFEAPAYRVLPSALTLAANVCRSHDGSFAVRRLLPNRRLARAELALDCFEPRPDATALLAPPQEAWLIGSPPRALEDLARRLHRRGWRVRMFESVADALHACSATQAWAPGLVVAAEPLGLRREAVIALRKGLPTACAVAWLVDVKAHRSRSPQTGIHVCAMPMGESQLASLAQRVGMRQPGSRGTLGPVSDGSIVLAFDSDLSGQLAGPVPF